MFRCETFKSHTEWSNAKRVSTRTITLLPSTGGTYHGLNWFGYVTDVLETRMYQNFAIIYTCHCIYMNWPCVISCRCRGCICVCVCISKKVNVIAWLRLTHSNTAVQYVSHYATETPHFIYIYTNLISTSIHGTRKKRKKKRQEQEIKISRITARGKKKKYYRTKRKKRPTPSHPLKKSRDVQSVGQKKTKTFHEHCNSTITRVFNTSGANYKINLNCKLEISY